MKKYDPNEKCPKCGFGERMGTQKTEYIHTELSSTGGITPFPNFKEIKNPYLEVTCTRCKFYLGQRSPLDTPC